MTEEFDQDGQWIDPGDEGEAEDGLTAESEFVVDESGESESLVAQLAQLRLERDTAADRAAVLESEIAKAKAGNEPAADDREQTPLERLITATQPGSAYESLLADLKELANDRKAREEVAEAAAAPEPIAELAFDASLLSSAHFKALSQAAAGGDRSTPEGMTIAEWRSLLRNAGV